MFNLFHSVDKELPLSVAPNKFRNTDIEVIDFFYRNSMKVPLSGLHSALSQMLLRCPTALSSIIVFPLSLLLQMTYSLEMCTLASIHKKSPGTLSNTKDQ